MAHNSDDSKPSSPTLAAHHRHFLILSGIDPAYLDRMIAAGSVRSGAYDGRPGIVFDWNPGNGDTVAQFRPDVPGTYPDGEDYPKYRTAKGLQVPLWRTLEGTPTGPVLLVEGTKQALAAAGYAADGTSVYAIAGCGNWNLESLQAMNVTGRQVTVVLDADVASNLQVWSMAEALRDNLSVYPGTEVSFARIPAKNVSDTTGLDDFLAAFPEAERPRMLAGLLGKASDKLPRKPKARTPQSPYKAGTAAYPAELTSLVQGLDDPASYRPPVGSIPTVGGGFTVPRGVNDAQAVMGPVLITRTFRDHLGIQAVELAWTVRGKAVTGTVNRKLLATGKALIEALADRGFPAIGGDASALEAYLTSLLTHNEERIPEEHLARWLGWQPDGTFVATTSEGVKVELPDDKMQRYTPAYRTAGNFEGWRAAVRGIESRSVPRVALATSFAANLLKPLGYDSFTVALDGRTSGGKTISAQGAASVWHDPTSSGGATMTWQTTYMAVEQRCGVAHGMLTWIDETQLVPERQASKVGETIYQFPDNKGRARGGSWVSMIPWSTILLATGEKNILTFVKGAGAAARVVQLHGRPFGNDGPASAAQADAYRDGVEANYGHAGPRFVAYLQARLAAGDREILRGRAAELAGVFKGDNDVANRRAERIGLLMLAEELACAAGVLPYAPLTAAQWLGAVESEELSDDRPGMAMDVVRGFLASNPDRVQGAASADKQPNGGWAAFRKRDRVTGRWFLAMNAETLSKVLADSGYDLAQVEAEWVSRTWLRLGKGSDGRPQVRTESGVIRAVCVWAEVIEAPDGAETDEDADASAGPQEDMWAGVTASTPAGLVVPEPEAVDAPVQPVEPVRVPEVQPVTAEPVAVPSEPHPLAGMLCFGGDDRYLSGQWGFANTQ